MKSRILSIVLSLAVVSALLILPVNADAADENSYRWGRYAQGPGTENPQEWYKGSQKIDDLSSAIGEDDVISISFYAASSNALNEQLGSLGGSTSIEELKFNGSGKYVIGSKNDPAEVNKLYISEKNTSEIEIYGNIENVEAWSENIKLTIHGNVFSFALTPSNNIGGSIKIDGDVELLKLNLPGKDLPANAKGFYNGNLEVTGKVSDTRVSWLTDADQNIRTDQSFGETKKALRIVDGHFANEGNVPLSTYTSVKNFGDILIYGLDGKVSKLSELGSDYVAVTCPGLSFEVDSRGVASGLSMDEIGIEAGSEISELYSLKSEYGLDISIVVCITTEAGGYDFTAEDMAVLKKAFPGAIISCYEICAQKGDFLFSKADTCRYSVISGRSRWYSDYTEIYDKKGDLIYPDTEGEYYSGLLSDELFDVYKKSGSEIAVDYHSPEEIKAFMEAHPVQNLDSEYETAPSSAAPYNAGALKNTVLQDALNAVNQMRYIAGLSYNVGLNEQYNKQAQAATLLNAANGTLSHDPAKPAGISDELYELGKTGAESSNLGFNYSSLARAICNGWMYDSDSSNRDTLGHRRWILNPAMGETGFGQTGEYTGMYVFDKNGNTRGTVAAWPAQNTPVELIQGNDYAWSYSSGKPENDTTVHVTLKNENTGKTWNFDSQHADGFFTVDNSEYGLMGCVIFAPSNLTVTAGDKYEVKITGLFDSDVLYHVNFFDLNAEAGSEQEGDSDSEQASGDSDRAGDDTEQFSDDIEQVSEDYMGWIVRDEKSYWYEGGVRQGNSADEKCFSYEGTLRGREIYDPESDGWYWLDVNADGAKASNKEVFMPYIYQDEEQHLTDDAWINEVAGLSNKTAEITARDGGEVVDLSAQLSTAIRSHGGDGAGKWVRYDAQGKMIKGWYTVKDADAGIYPEQVGNTYYYDRQTGLMAKGNAVIDGTAHYFDEVTGVMQW